MFAFFERQLKPTQAPERPEPPASLLAFYWHYAREARRLFIALFAAGFVVALLDTMIPVFIGRVVTLLTLNPPDQPFENSGRCLVDGIRVAGRASRCDGDPAILQSGDRRQRLEPGIAGRAIGTPAPIVVILSERFRRPHRNA
jgi:hypothetical protein